MHLRKHWLIVLFVMVDNMNGNFVSDKYFKYTKAKTWQNTMPKPTSTVRDNISELDAVENTSSLYLSERRMASRDIWKWDHWCQLQPKTGNCSERLVRYFYDTHIDKCMNFSYSGCSGNNNNFDTKELCERFCVGAPFMAVKDDATYFCGIQPDAGICLALSTKYYFDVDASDCKEFQYGGCGGNRNRFDSKKSCLTECGGISI